MFCTTLGKYFVFSLVLIAAVSIPATNSFSQCTPPPDGMISWWTGDDEALDAKGANNGFVQNGAAFGAGKVGRSFSFDGIDDAVEIPDNPSLDISGAMTISFWAKLTTVDPWRGFISKSSYSGGYADTAFVLKLTPAGRLNFLATSNGGESGLMWPESNSVVTAGDWHHYTVVYSPGSYVRFYIDGTLDAERTSGIVPAIHNSGQPVRIGNDVGNPINGFMDEIMIFGRSLSASEVQSIYSGGSYGVCPSCVAAPSGMVSLFRGESNPLDSNLLNNAELVSAAAFSDGKVDKSFSFPGAAAHARVTAPAGLPLGSAPRTVELWVKTPVNLVSSTETGIVQYGTASTGQMFGLITSANAPGRLYFYGHSADLAAQQVLQPNTWYHLAVTYDGTILRLYVNGRLENSGAVALNTVLNGDGLTIGYRPGVSAWTGLIDEPSIYNRELTPAEIESIVSAGKGGKCNVCTPVPVGLISAWRGEDDALDSRSGNNGNLLNGTGFTDGISGRAFSINGSGQTVEIADHASLRPTAGLTLVGWYRFNSAGPNSALFSKPLGSGTQNSFALWIQSGSLYGSTGGGFVSRSFSPTPGRWYQIGYTYDDATGLHRLIIDGEIVATGVNAVNPTYDSNPLLIGSDRDNGMTVLQFDGAADEVSMFSRALSTREIEAINVARSASNCAPTATTSPSGLVAWWHGDGSGADASGNSNHATSANGAGFAVGHVGQAFRFDGINDYFDVADHPALRLSDELTIEFWAKRQRLGIEIVVEKGGDWTGGQTNYGAGLHQVNHMFYFYYAGGVKGASGPSDTEWHHYAVTAKHGQTSAEFYIDGTFVATDYNDGSPTISLVTSNAPLHIGAQPNAPSYFGQLLLDELTIYNRKLAADEVGSQFRAGIAGKLKTAITPAGLFLQADRRRNSNRPLSVITGVGDSTVTFPSVTAQGATQQTSLDPLTLPSIPAGYALTGLSYDVATSAAIVGSPVVCFNVPALSAQFSGLRVLHLEYGQWIDRTNLTSVSPNLCTTALGSLSPFAIAQLIPTAANVSVGGRVTSGKTAIAGVTVTMTDASGIVRSARTNSFGYYRFHGVPSGETYIFEVSAGKYSFINGTRAIFVGDAIGDLDFEAIE